MSSLALDFLRHYFARPDAPQQVEFAKAAGMTGANVTDLLKGDVAISARNQDKILRGLATEKDRRQFLLAYLRDSIPTDYADSILVNLRAEAVQEDPQSDDDLAALIRAYEALPSDLHRKRTVRFLQHLRRDAGLRDLFSRTVAYLEESELGSALSLSSSSEPPADTDPDQIVGYPSAAAAARPKSSASARAKPPASPKRRV